MAVSTSPGRKEAGAHTPPPSRPGAAALAASPRAHLLAILLTLLAIVVLAYLPSLDGGFVWDDVILIRDNPVLRSPGGPLAGLAADFFAGTKGDLSAASGYWRPLVTLLNRVTLAAFGADPLPFRLENLLLHLAVSVLFFGLLRRLGLGLLPAALGLGTFALHPVQTEAVAFISGRPDLLAACFVLLAVHAYLVARAAPGRGRALAGGAVALLCWLLAVAAKETALLLPLLLAVLEWLGLDGTSTGTGTSTSTGTRPGARNRLPATLLALLGLAALGLRAAAGPVVAAHGGVSASTLPLVAASLTGLYARLLVWPQDLHVGYDDFPAATFGSATAAGLAVWVGLAALLLLGRRRAPRAVLAGAWFAFFLTPVLQLVPIRSLAAERYLYLPSMGLALAVALGLQWLAGPGAGGGTSAWLRPLRRVASLGVVLLLLAAGGATMARAADWRSELTLWSAELGGGHAGFTAYQNLGAALAEQGGSREAAALLVLAWRDRPGHPIVFRTLARLGAAGHLPGCPPLPAALRASFLAAALAPHPSPAELGRLGPALEQAGCPALARLGAEMAGRLAGTE